MREESSHQGYDNTVQLLPSRYGPPSFKLIDSSPSPHRLRIMPSAAAGRGDRGSSKQRPGFMKRFNTRTALLSILAITPGAMTQSCIPLAGSTQCPAFSSASISTDSTLVGFLYVVSQLKECRSDTNYLLVHSCNTFQAPQLSTSN
jgi:hypothetical protein